MKFLFGLLIAMACAAGVLWAGHFGYGPVVIVNQWEYKIPLLLGAPWREPISEPGIAFRWPLIETMVTIDKRLKYLDARPAEVLHHRVIIAFEGGKCEEQARREQM